MSNEGRKDDQDKLRYDLVPPDALEEIVRIYNMGAKKYTDRNWEKGIKFGRVFAAAMRHLWSWWRGEELDPESKLSHLAHAAWNCIALLAYTKRGMMRFDDRPKPGIKITLTPGCYPVVTEEVPVFIGREYLCRPNVFYPGRSYDVSPEEKQALWRCPSLSAHKRHGESYYEERHRRATMRYEAPEQEEHDGVQRRQEEQVWPQRR